MESKFDGELNKFFAVFVFTKQMCDTLTTPPSVDGHALAASLFHPGKITDLRPDASSVEELKAFPFLQT